MIPDWPMKFQALFLVTLLLIESFLMATSSAKTQPLDSLIPRGETLVIAHRGASGTAPENTLPAVQKALEMGADMVEIDVHLSQDGQVMVIHDHTLDKTTNGTGLVSMSSSTEIQELDAGSWFDTAYAGTKVPTLEEVITVVDGKARLLIEVKKGEKYYEGIEDTILSLIHRYGASEWCVLQSFHDHVIENFKALNTELPVHKLIVGPVPLSPFLYDGKLRLGGIAKYKEYAGINMKKGYAKKGLVSRIHQQGQTTFVWTVNQPDKMRELIEIGVDGIITNHPEYFAKD